jgi:hypothetical protein
LEQLTTRLVAIATRVQTPLALAGLIVIVLYAIFSQILRLDIFANVGGNGTLQLVSDVLQKLFILAIVSLCLGVASYLLGLYLRSRLPEKASNLTLIDERLDTDSSDYVDTEPGTSSNIIRRNAKGTPKKHELDSDRSRATKPRVASKNS